MGKQLSSSKVNKETKSPLKTNSEKNSEMTVETSRMSRKLDVIKTDLNSQILQVVDSAISEKALSQLQNSLGKLQNGLNRTLVFGPLGIKGTLKPKQTAKKNEKADPKQIFTRVLMLSTERRVQ